LRCSWFLSVLYRFLSGRTKITAEPGENVTLPCRTKNNHPVLVVEWIRNDMGELKHVALYRDGRFDKNGQDPTYENRVDLQDREMKDGDVSLVLMNVTTNHTGTYECRVIQRGNKRRKRSNIKGDPICIISLDVAPRPPSGESVFLCIRTSSSFLVLHDRWMLVFFLKMLIRL
uniref:Ig-like domain-containing protein n=1 Tax=Cyprinodon variegatus TaxID=28743 RepID=A0A3Q2D4T6_CYPVA